MSHQNYTTSFLVSKPTTEVFNCINNINGWWTENTEGHSQKEGDEFEVRFGDVHYSKQRLTEIVPGKKVVWLVTDSRINFVKDKSEWTGTSIVFDIAEKDGQTLVSFTHVGLVPQIECYGGCSGAWGEYINDSLKNLITTGAGMPAKKEPQRHNGTTEHNG